MNSVRTFTFAILAALPLAALPAMAQNTVPVSYTHLDVYKRQRQHVAVRGCSSAQ